MAMERETAARPLAATTRSALRARLGRRWRMLPVVLVALALIGLALRPAQSTQASPLAPDFTLPAASGVRGPLALHTLRGHAVLLNFFNTNCPPCIEEMPLLRQTAQAYRARGVIVLEVATGGDTVATAGAFARAHHQVSPVVVDVRQDVAWRYNVRGWPTSFFLDAQGRLQGEYIGPLDPQTVRNGLAQIGAIRCDGCTRLDPPSIAVTTSPSMDSTLSADVVFSPPRAAAWRPLRDQRGHLVTLASLRGKVVAVTFVSAVCTAQCPLVGQAITQVRHDLGRAAARLSIVAISVAPERDSSGAIRHFAAKAGWRGADWHYLSAPRRLLAPLWAAYGVYVGPPPKPGQDPEHYAGLYLIDPWGKLRAYYDVPFLAPRVAASVRALLSASR